MDNQTNRIIAPAPIFDKGLLLLYHAMENEFGEGSQYVETRRPATYNNFIEFVKPFITHRQKEKVRKILDFHFTKKTKYKLSNKRLKQLEKNVQGQAKKSWINDII